MSNSPVVNWREIKSLHKFLNKKGEILVWTKVNVGPKGFEHQVPYFVGIVEFEDKTKRSVQIVDCEEKDLKVGLKIETVVRKLGKVEAAEVIDYTVKVKPI
ncbi:OB-fold domain-containing protein [Candidatus Daviesbacteria bacterium]|nr:OB-fold domain-containing protein [Candidatus Daviesbacteria bacterium]